MKVRKINQLVQGALVRLSVVLVILSVFVGLVCYVFGSLQNGADLIKDVAGILSSELNENYVRKLVAEVDAISKDIPEFEIEEYEGTDIFAGAFLEIQGTPEYYNTRFVLERYNKSTTRVDAVYLVKYEPEKNREVYICYGSYGVGDTFYVGTMATFYPEDFEKVVINDKKYAFIDYKEGKVWSYGYIPWYGEDGDLICYIGVDLIVDDMVTGIINFVLQVALAMAVSTFIILRHSVVQTKKTVKPIIDVTEAAEKYLKYNGKLNKKDLDENSFKPKVSGGFFSKTEGGNVYEYRRLVKALKAMENGLDDYIARLIDLKGEQERSHADLRLATDIQANTLPNIFPPFPDRTEFDIYASMRPAKGVGGDFFDFFFIDRDHIALVIADVSGKGFPAALFMMASKIIISERAKYGGTPGEILTDANKRICNNNAADMFVTVWLGILEISTGKMVAANGGHEYPIIKHADGKFELYKDNHGFVLGGMENAKYHTYELNLSPGDVLYVYTDGVAEATNSKNTLFGTERMLQALNECTKDDVTEYINYMSQSVDKFVGTAPQFDDLTQLCFKYNGPDADYEALHGKTITVEATKKNLDKVLKFVDSILEEAQAGIKPRRQIEIAVEELFTNIASYAYGTGDGYATIHCHVENSVATVVFEDQGVPYNPLKKEDPDITLSAEDRQIGGLGIYMVKKSMDEFTYDYIDGKNTVTIKKKVVLV